MSHNDYVTSRKLAAEDVSFAALVMAAMRRADTGNMARLRLAFPDMADELVQRYNAPGGLLPDEQDVEEW